MPNRLRGLEIDHQLKGRRLLNRQISGLGLLRCPARLLILALGQRLRLPPNGQPEVALGQCGQIHSQATWDRQDKMGTFLRHHATINECLQRTPLGFVDNCA